MFSKLFLFSFLFNVLLKSNSECAITKNGQDRVVRSASFMDTIHTIIGKLKRIFSSPPAAAPSQSIKENKKVKSGFSQYLEDFLKKKKINDDKEKELRLGSNSASVAEFDFPKPTLNYGRPEMNTEQMIAAHGYLSESHTVLTKDGYLLTLHRVLRDFNSVSHRVAILHHGLLGSSEDWLVLGTYNALPYLLVENGYDVWLLNARGNRYSRVHANKNVDWPDFWDFSWHEMGLYDLPAAIDYIGENTKSPELNFIGHSMGATALLVLLSSTPEYNDILSSGTLLAPLAYMYHAKGPIKLLANFYRENGLQSLNFLGNSEFMENDVFPEQIIQKYCKGDNRSCFNPLLLFGNGGNGKWGAKILADVLAHVPAGGSVKTVLHYVQLVKSGYFQMYDYGIDGNHRIYESGAPTFYDTRGITLPIAVFSSASDWLATQPDIQTLVSQLQDVTIHHVVKSVNFGHFDFIWSPQARELIYNFLIPMLDKKSSIQSSAGGK